MTLNQSFPWVQAPMIINAPMGGSAGPDLALAVTSAGGLGFIGAGSDVSNLDRYLTQISKIYPPATHPILPIGVGLLPFIDDLPTVLSALSKHTVAVVWLFAARELSDYATWSSQIRTASPKLQIWVQVGSVQAALTVAEQVRPETICVQGLDAGGHGFEKGAGIVTLLPEVADALAKRGFGGIHLIAAGGITEGRGAASALALGAQGVVMGTRFLAASETRIHPGHRKAVIAARDGGQYTVRAKLFDNLRGPNVWPGDYDGRSIVTESWSDHLQGVEIEEIRRRYAEAIKGVDAGFGVDGKGRVAIWAGTGVGLVTKEQSAAEIVREVREDAVKALERARAML